MNKQLVVRCRGIILQNNKILAVKHYEGANFYALPGGHLEFGENTLECIKREIIEELGIEPKIGRLLYVNNLINESGQSVEFFFEITNADDYFDLKKLGGTHRDELVDICWVEKNDTKNILPEQIKTDLNGGTILSNIVRFI